MMIVLAIDLSSCIGKVDKASLPQQALMEMVVDGIEKDIEEWHGVTLNENGEVTDIVWDFVSLGEALNLQWLPTTVQSFSAYTSNLTGTIPLETLPETMKHLCLSFNKLSGEIDLTHLPEGLEELILSGNRLSGPVDLTELPSSLKSLFLNDNNFLGETDFSQLPTASVSLDVDMTQIEGDIFLEKGVNKSYNVGNSNVKLYQME